MGRVGSVVARSRAATRPRRCARIRFIRARRDRARTCAGGRHSDVGLSGIVADRVRRCKKLFLFAGITRRDPADSERELIRFIPLPAYGALRSSARSPALSSYADMF